MTQLEFLSVSMRTTPPKAGDDWCRIITDKKASVAKVYIYDEIGYWGTNAKEFAAQLNEIEESTIELHLNSPGGSVFDGLAIMAALRSHSAEVVAYVDGMAASAASFILQAADKRIIGRNAQIMVHDAKAYAGGNAAQMRKAAELLDRVSDNIADIYAVKSGKATKEEWRAIMVSGDTWYDGNEALDAGLVDEVTDNPEDDDQPEDTSNRTWNATEVAAFLQTPVEKLIASLDRPTITNTIEESDMTGQNPQSSTPAVPAVPTPPPAPVAQQQPVTYPEALNCFLNEGVFDFNAAASELTALRTFKSETVEQARKDFVKALVESGKLSAGDDSIEKAEAFALGLSNEGFSQWKAVMDGAPQNSLTAQHGVHAGTGPQAPQAAAAASELDREIRDAQEIVDNHRAAGMSEEVLKGKQSFKNLQALLAKRDGQQA